MSEEHELENKRDQELRMTCIDMATRVVGKPVYLTEGKHNEVKKHHDDVVDVATEIYEFVTNK